jgi:peptide/nickel transport system substrate-binding protein
VPLTADDVVYTYALLDSAGYADFSSTAAFWKTVESQKLSSDLLRFRLVQPFSSFPLLLTVGILPEHALRGSSVLDLAGHPFNLSPIGTGPYQFAALHSKAGNGIDTVHLQRSPTHQERPEAQVGYLFRDLVFRFFDNSAAAIDAFKSGEIDALAMAEAPEQLLALPKSQHFRQALSQLSVLIFNWNDTPFRERRVRQALALSLDLPRLAQAHYGTAVVFADSPYILGSSVYQPQDFWRAYDLERANTPLPASELGSAAPPEDDSDDEDASEKESAYNLLVSGSNRLLGLAEEIAAQWRLLGLDFRVESADALTFSNRLETSDFDAAIVTQRIGADRDLFRFWHPAQHGGGNYGAASHNEIAELIETARGEIYAGRRALLYQQLQEVFAEQALAIPLTYPLLTYIASDSIEGIKLGFLSSPADRFRGLQHWRPSTLAG